MKKYNIDNFKGGWFIGDFNPSLIKTKDFEIAIKYYKSGDEDDEHVHLLADEYTVIVKGQVIMNGEIFEEKDIIFIEKGEYVKFKVLKDTINVVIKIPSVIGDKIIK